MKHLTAFAAAFALVGTVVSAHGDYDHIRGIVLKLTAASVSVETPQKTTKTVALDAKTTFERSGNPATLADLKIGDRVVIDVHKGTLRASLVRFGAAKPAAKMR
jgi:hypothetical protein